MRYPSPILYPHLDATRKGKKKGERKEGGEGKKKK